jgi:2-dehydropantoate 2-reductase
MGDAMRWMVMGAGATGGYFGGRLAQAGRDVTFIARGEHLAALRSRGLVVQSRLGDFTVAACATDDPAPSGIVDVVLFAVKSYDTELAAEAIAPAVGPHTAVLCVQNGVDNEERLAARFGAERVLGGATRIEATILEPGVIAHRSPFARFDFGTWKGPAGDRERAILDDLRGAGIDAELSDDGRRVVWEKFLILCAGAALTSLTRAPYGEVFACEDSRALLRQALEEIAAVGTARGVDLVSSPGVDRAMAMLGGLPPTMRTSMQNDLEAGRRIELEALCGTVVRYGRESGVPTPVHSFVYAALKPASLAAERAYRERASQPAG